MATMHTKFRKLFITFVSVLVASSLIAPTAYAAPGDLDLTFGSQGISGVYTISDYDSQMVTDASGNIYVVAKKYGVSYATDIVVYKMNASGTLVWTGTGMKAFDFSSNDSPYDIALDSVGRIYVVGATLSEPFIMRLTTEGILDSSFGTGGKIQWQPSETTYNSFRSISIDSGDTIYVTGFGSFGYTSPNRTVKNSFVASFTTDGSVNTAFSDDGYVFIPPSTYEDYLYDSAIDNNGKIVVAGNWRYRDDWAPTGSYTQFLMARINVDGTFDGTFGSGGILKEPRNNLRGWWRDINIDSDNNYLLTGMTYETSSQQRWNVAFDKYSDAGVNLLSKTFDIGIYDDGRFVSQGPNGTIYIGAKTTYSVGSSSWMATVFMRIDSAGRLDQSFGVGGVTNKYNHYALTAGATVTGGLYGLVVNGDNITEVIKFSSPNFASEPLSIGTNISSEQVGLTWNLPLTDGGSAITDYQVEFSRDNLTWSQFSEGLSLTRSATVTSLTPNTSYYFRVAAITANGMGMYAYTPQIVTALPTVPGAPSLSCSISVLQVSLAWSPSQSGGRFETGYLIQRKLGSGEWADLTSKIPSVLTHSETTNSSQSGDVSYRLRSSNDGGNSDWSSVCTVTVPSVPSAPSSVTNPSLSGLNMNLTWSAPANGGIQIDSYEIEKRIGLSGSWTQVYNSGPIGAGTQTYSETKLLSNSGEIHYYRLRAINAVGNSTWSSTYSLQVPSVPTSPTSIIATANTSEVTISWSNPGNFETSSPLTYAFQITNNGITWSDFTPSSYPSAASAVFDSAISGTNYRFRVKSVNTFGESAWSSSSNLIQLATPTPPPTTPPTTPPGNTTVIINTPEVVINTPAVTVYSPTVSVGAKLSATSIATGLGVAIPSKAKTTVAIAKTSKKFCKVSGGKVVGIKSGPCVATVTVQAPKPKKGKKPAAVKKSVTVQIS
jgi:uncharacterized delta-60 repeat protein